MQALKKGQEVKDPKALVKKMMMAICFSVVTYGLTNFFPDLIVDQQTTKVVADGLYGLVTGFCGLGMLGLNKNVGV